MANPKRGNDVEKTTRVSSSHWHKREHMEENTEVNIFQNLKITERLLVSANEKF